MFYEEDKIYSPSQINEVLDILTKEEKFIKSNKKEEYFNIPCSFDIETTSFYDDLEIKKDKYIKVKRAMMYEWTLGLNGLIIIGRKWEEFEEVINYIVDRLKLGDKRYLVVYVHNLSFEFQFLKERFKWVSVFANNDRQPIYAISSNGIYFKCSYMLSNYSLATLGKNLTKYKVEKMVGDLDYEKIRNSLTPLTDKELKYCINDVKVVMAYIKEEMEEFGDITRIPNTNTGKVRRYCKRYCFYGGSKHNKRASDTFHNYQYLMNHLTLCSDEYKLLHNAFQGGFTHANPCCSTKVYENIASYDFTSSYPTVMIAEKFPMSHGKWFSPKSKEEFEKALRNYCCVFEIEFHDIEPKLFQDNPIPYSKCIDVKNPVINNGRVFSADSLTITITEIDYEIYKQFYNWKSFKIYNMMIYRKGYLPSNFVISILELYKKKTELKGVKDKETEYQISKGMLNSCYGMTVTDVNKPVISYNNEDGWIKTPVNLEDSIESYNKSKNRFLFYAWGIYVTAYARRNLFMGIKECGNDYLYADTDSLKIMHHESHQDFFVWYNNNIIEKLERACKFHHIDVSYIKPKTIDGIEKPLGVFDFEGVYVKFKTLGAKRYMTYMNNELSITVSGVNKKEAVPYLLKKYKTINKCFDAFQNELFFPKEYSGKMTHSYIDEETRGIITDYLGNTEEYHELSSVHIEKSEYSLSLSETYISFLSYINYLLIGG